MTYLILAGAALICLMVILAGRWKRCVAGVVVSAALVAGCATAQSGPVMQFACAPEGLPVLDSTWQIVDTKRVIATKTESGEPVLLTMIALTKGDKALLLSLIGGDLVFVDPNPLDQGVPLLLNARFLTADGTIKAQPDGECAWFPLLTGSTT